MGTLISMTFSFAKLSSILATKLIFTLRDLELPNERHKQQLWQQQSKDFYFTSYCRTQKIQYKILRSFNKC